MTGRFLPLFSLALATCLVPVISQAEEKATPRSTTGPSSVWKVEKGGKHFYIGGTIHLLRKEDYPLPDVFEQAYADSAKLVFELPPGSEGDGEVVVRMQQMGRFADGDELSNHVSEDTMKKVLAWASENSFPQAVITKLRPWLLALTIAMLEYQQLGADASHGVDKHFEQKASQDGKGGEGLESVEFQLSIFSKLSDKLQEELLMQTFTEAETMQKDFTDLIGAWRAGDTVKLQEFLFRDADKYPELMEDFLFKRNKAWIPTLLKYLEKGEKVFVLVGAGHLGGKSGVLDLLKEKGCTVTQLGVPAAAAK